MAGVLRAAAAAARTTTLGMASRLPRSSAATVAATQSAGVALAKAGMADIVSSRPELTPNSVSIGPGHSAVTDTPTFAIS